MLLSCLPNRDALVLYKLLTSYSYKDVLLAINNKVEYYSLAKFTYCLKLLRKYYKRLYIIERYPL
jgi:hypothetical protein